MDTKNMSVCGTYSNSEENQESSSENYQVFHNEIQELVESNLVPIAINSSATPGREWVKIKAEQGASSFDRTDWNENDLHLALGTDTFSGSEETGPLNIVALRSNSPKVTKIITEELPATPFEANEFNRPVFFFRAPRSIHPFRVEVRNGIILEFLGHGDSVAIYPTEDCEWLGDTESSPSTPEFVSIPILDQSNVNSLLDKVKQTHRGARVFLSDWKEKGSSIVWDDANASSLSVDWLIKKIMPRKGIGLLFGQTTAGKSFMALELAACIVDGREFFGHKVKATGGVLFANAESPESMRGRLNALRQERFGGAPIVSPESITYENSRLPIAAIEVSDLSKPERLKAFKVKIKTTQLEMNDRFGCELRMVVIDTAVAAFGFSEDPDASTVTKMLRTLEGIGHELGVFILPIHHAGKSKDAGEHGSYAWRGSVDVSILVDVDRNSVGGADERRIFVKKNRHYPNEGWNQPFELKTIPIGVDEDGDDIISAIVAPTGGVEGQDRHREPSPHENLRSRFFEAYGRLKQGVEPERDGERGLVVMVRYSAIKDDLISSGFLDTNERNVLTSTARTRLARLKDELLAPGGGWAMSHDRIFQII